MPSWLNSDTFGCLLGPERAGWAWHENITVPGCAAPGRDVSLTGARTSSTLPCQTGPGAGSNDRPRLQLTTWWCSNAVISQIHQRAGLPPAGHNNNISIEWYVSFMVTTKGHILKGQLREQAGIFKALFSCSHFMFPTKGNSWLNHTDPVITRSAGHTACTGASERDCESEDRPRARLLARARIGNMHYYGTSCCCQPVVLLLVTLTICLPCWTSQSWHHHHIRDASLCYYTRFIIYGSQICQYWMDFGQAPVIN